VIKGRVKLSLIRKEGLRAEHDSAARTFFLYLATPVIWISFFKDLAVVGFKWEWLLIRLAYLPYILLVNYAVRRINKKTDRFYEAPLWAASAYITAFCTYFSVHTGYLSSRTVLGLVLLYFGAAVMPVSPFSFVFTTVSSVLFFLIGCVIHGGWGVLGDGLAISNLVPLIIFAYIIFHITYRIRMTKIEAQHALLDTLTKQTSVINIQSRRLAQTEIDASIGKMANQVAHDIRSPLAALEMVVKTLPEIPEQKRLLIRDALGRIRDIANNLLQKNRDNLASTQSLAGATEAKMAPDVTVSETRSTELLSILIDSLVSEKRMQFRSQLGIEIDSALGPTSYGIFSTINTIEFKRMLSNLINNAVEALGDEGRVSLSLKQVEKMASIRVADNGPGIAPAILAKLGRRGVTHGKKDGSGLGLHHARETTEAWGGTLTIESELGQGTSVILNLPLANAPSWFVEKLRLSTNSFVAVLDDDTSIHQIWDGRLQSQGAGGDEIQILHFSTPEQIRNFVKEMGSSDGNGTFLVDYELIGFTETGLDLVEELGIANQSVLVTSRYEEPHVRARCERLGIRLIPKGLAGFVPIEIKKTSPHSKSFSKIDAVLIDDDTLVHQSWQIAAKRAGKTLVCFEDPTDFLLARAGFPASTTIYIDSTLRNGIVGEMVAKDIFGAGFEEIILATGKEVDHLHAMPWIKKVVGKAPPF
jgi:signal transduction histidine kinase